MKRNILLGLFLMGLIIVGLGYVKDSSNISANETTTSQSTANVTETTEESSTDKQIPYIPRPNPRADYANYWFMSSYTPTTFNWHADFPDAFWYNVYFAKGVTSLASGDDGKQNSWIDGRVDMTQDPQNGYIMMSADTSTGRSFEVKFQAVRYTLTFNGNGHTGATIPASSSQIESEVISSIPTNGPTKTGHTFAGWYNATSGRRICLQEI